MTKPKLTKQQKRSIKEADKKLADRIKHKDALFALMYSRGCI